MREITLQVERDEASGVYVASWDDPAGAGGITTQGNELQELQDNVREAVRCHFEQEEMPREIRLHFVHDLVLSTP
jgi:predicted RNase H-like HicB family nuclease